MYQDLHVVNALSCQRFSAPNILDAKPRAETLVKLPSADGVPASNLRRYRKFTPQAAANAERSRPFPIRLI
jgi:hypothetical protein